MLEATDKQKQICDLVIQQASLWKTSDKDIHYRNQFLLIKQFPSSSLATNYVPDWNDMFEKDWVVL